MSEEQQTIEWIECAKQEPPEGEMLETKIDDERGVRNQQTLLSRGNLWWTGKGADAIYVYYRPTHWRPMTVAKKYETVIAEIKKKTPQQKALEQELDDLHTEADALEKVLSRAESK
jgi:hypothetical protein